MGKDNTADTADALPVRLAFRVSYLGSRFFGSQIQAAHRTVEGEFVATCQRLGLFDDWKKAGFLSAGRTDRGVHACGQIVAFTTPVPERAVEALNRQLPADLWCTGHARTGPEFHPRYDAVSRTYRYFFPTVPEDTRAMERAARNFIGNHNFTNFARSQGRNPLRTVLSATVGDDGDFIYFEVKAHSFLWHQVRCMASALYSIGTGAYGEEKILTYLCAKPEKSIPPAPAEGLVLWDTDCNLSWSGVTPPERSRTFLEHLGRHHALMGKVCRVIGGSDRQGPAPPPDDASLFYHGI